jgi:hypothetical protein
MGNVQCVLFLYPKKTFSARLKAFSNFITGSGGMSDRLLQDLIIFSELNCKAWIQNNN